MVPVPRPREVRTFALTDLVGGACRATGGAAGWTRAAPIIYCSVTAALLWPRPGAIWLDTLAAENRPGRHGVWQRPLERRRLAQAPLVMSDEPREAPLAAAPVRGAGAGGGVRAAGRPSGHRGDHLRRGSGEEADSTW